MLFAKLASLGYRGKVLSIIQSLYFNDSVRVNVNGAFTESIFFDLGVKQGCSLSPLLFAIYIDDLVRSRHRGRLGIEIGKEVISVITFADDIMCIAKESKEGTEAQLECIITRCRKMRMSMSATKTFVSTLSIYRLIMRKC